MGPEDMAEVPEDTTQSVCVPVHQSPHQSPHQTLRQTHPLHFSSSVLVLKNRMCGCRNGYSCKTRCQEPMRAPFIWWASFPVLVGFNFFAITVFATLRLSMYFWYPQEVIKRAASMYWLRQLITHKQDCLTQETTAGAASMIQSKGGDDLGCPYKIFLDLARFFIVFCFLTHDQTQHQNTDQGSTSL